jgi:hypothetical protein
VTAPGYPPVSEWRASGRWDQWLRELAQAVNLLLRGKANCTSRVVLTAGASSTVLTDERIGMYSVVLLEAETASAAAARSAGLWVVPESGRAVIHHPASAAGDMVFRAIIMG